MKKLSENCLMNVLSLTSPKDVCMVSLVDIAFFRAAKIDQLWEKFLPTDYEALISQATNPPGADILKTFKQLYLWICDNPLIIDEGTKSFSLEKWSGKRCYMLAARDLSMTPEHTSRFSKLVPEPNSRFHAVVEVFGVKQVEIRGDINTKLLSENTTYTAFLVYKQRIDSLEHHGIGNNFTLRVPRMTNEENSTEMRDESMRADGWWEVKLRDYYNGSGEDGDLNLRAVIGLMERSCLIVQGIDIRPKEI